MCSSDLQPQAGIGRAVSSLPAQVVVPRDTHLAKQGRQFEGTPADPPLVGLGLELRVDLVDAFLEQWTKELSSRQKQSIPKLLLPFQWVGSVGSEQGLQEALDFLLECRL